LPCVWIWHPRGRQPDSYSRTQAQAQAHAHAHARTASALVNALARRQSPVESDRWAEGQRPLTTRVWLAGVELWQSNVDCKQKSIWTRRRERGERERGSQASHARAGSFIDDEVAVVVVENGHDGDVVPRHQRHHNLKWMRGRARANYRRQPANQGQSTAGKHGVITGDECGGCPAQSAHVLSCMVLPSGVLYSA